MSILRDKKYPVVVSIAGLDGSGGAGMTADMRVCGALGVYSGSVLTAVTVQDTRAVHGVCDVEVECIRGQLEVVLGDLEPDVVKVGMLHKVSVIEVVAEALEGYAGEVVVDPVMVATSGDRLLEKEAEGCLKELLLPLADVVTPNFEEFEVLDKDENCAPWVIVTGVKPGVDSIYKRGEGKVGELVGEWVETENTHGTGCTFSAAVAAYRALGFEWAEAFLRAKRYVSGCIESGARYRLGRGRGPVDHLYAFRREALC